MCSDALECGAKASMETGGYLWFELHYRIVKAGYACISGISKTWRSVRQDFAKAKIDLKSKLAMDQPAVSVGIPFEIRFERDSEGLRLFCCGPIIIPIETAPSPEILHSLEKLGSIFETKITDCLTRTEEEDDVWVSPNNLDDLMSGVKNKGCSPRLSAECSCSYQHCVVARPKEPQQVTLERVTKELLFKGRPSSIPRLLAAYGRKDLQLGGQSAVSRIVDGESRCEYCKTKKMQCIIVDRDGFWKRNQCVACAQRKGKCSLEIATRKIERRKR